MKTRNLLLLFTLLICFTSQLPALDKNLSFEKMAGTYSISNGWDGQIIKLSNNGEYSFQNWSDLCLVDRNIPNDCLNYDKEWGNYTVDNKFIIFTRKGFRSQNKAIPPQYTKLFVISWSERVYLIDRDKILQFVNAVNRKETVIASAFHHIFFRRLGDEKKTVSGFPRLPDSWNSYFLKEPVTAKIIEMGEKDGVIIAKIDKGRKAKLKIGMQIGDDCAGSSYHENTITSVEKNYSLVKIKGYTKVGNIVSTRFGDISKCVLDGVEIIIKR